MVENLKVKGKSSPPVKKGLDQKKGELTTAWVQL